MGKVVGIIAFLLITPFLSVFLEGLKAVISAALQEKESPKVFQYLRGFIQLWQEPWDVTSHRPKLFAILYLILVLLAGALFFAGGSLAISVLLLIFAQAARIYTIYFSDTTVSASKVPELQRDITALTLFAGQLLLVTAGLYCFTGVFLHRGSFLVANVVFVHTAPALYIPAMLIGHILLLLYGPHTGLLFRQQREDTAGKLRAFFETGLWYQKVTLYGVLFLINYAGTVLSGVTAIGVCLLVWLLEPLLRDPHSKPPEPVVLSAVSAILLVASFVNLLIILP